MGEMIKMSRIDFENTTEGWRATRGGIDESKVAKSLIVKAGSWLHGDSYSFLYFCICYKMS